MWKLLVVAYFKVGLIIIGAARIYFKRDTANFQWEHRQTRCLQTYVEAA
jgi:hypothetical protein